MAHLDDDDASLSEEPAFVHSKSVSPVPGARRAYRYTALEPWQIRVLFQTPSDDDTLSLRLQVTPIQRFSRWPVPKDTFQSRTGSTPYTAISYTWGDQTRDRREILVNGETMSVGANCYATLKQLLPHGKGGQAFWIDAVCIDQENLAEKNEQVQIMAEIFRQSQDVISYVGPHADDSSFLCKLIRQFHDKNILVRGTPRLLFELMKLDADASFSERVNSRGSLVLSLDSAKRAKNALREFASRDYFHRLWIVQELTVTQVVHIACGNDMIALHELTNFSCYLSFKRFDSLFLNPFKLPDRIIAKLTSTKAVHSDGLYNALWLVEGPNTFARTMLRVLPMFVALRTRDEYQRNEVVRTCCIPQYEENEVVLNAYKLVAEDNGASNTPYLALVARLQGWGCSEVRDMLYGLINIARFPSWCPPDVKPRPDYSQSVLQTAMEAARVADYVDTHEDCRILGCIALLCKVFRLGHKHPDIIAARQRRRLRAESIEEDDTDIWSHKYDVALTGQKSPKLEDYMWRNGTVLTASTASARDVHVEELHRRLNLPGQTAKAFVVVPDHVVAGDILIELPIGTVENCNQQAESICIVARMGADRIDRVVGQAFATDLVALPKTPYKELQRCTLDLEDLIVLYCQLKHWAELRQRESWTTDDLAFLNEGVCRSDFSTWVS